MDYTTAVRLFNSNCHYCNGVPSNLLKLNNKVIGRYQGIDRVDNNKGYISGNIVPCCKYCNSFKSNRTKIEFMDHLSRLYWYMFDKL